MCVYIYIYIFGLGSLTKPRTQTSSQASGPENSRALPIRHFLEVLWKDAADKELEDDVTAETMTSSAWCPQHPTFSSTVGVMN